MNQPRKLIDIVNLSTRYLADHHIENARLNAELLLGHALNMKRVELYVNFEKPLADDELQRIREMLRRRGNHEPLQYIIGETEFFGLRFYTNPAALVPRPETELLVEKTLELIKTQTNVDVLDIGTGSGNIAVSLAVHHPGVLVTAIDVSKEALQLAHRNADLHCVADRITFTQLDVMNDDDVNLLSVFDLIVSNPPYISTDERELLPRDVREFEPEDALYAGDDGLVFYRRLADKYRQWLRPGGYVCVETGFGMADNVCRLFELTGLIVESVYPDLNGIERIVVAKSNS